VTRNLYIIGIKEIKTIKRKYQCRRK